MRGGATALSRRDSGQTGVAAMSVLVNLVAVELAFKIALVPKQSLSEVFAPYGPDQSLNESMRTGCAGNGLDLINLKDPGSPASAENETADRDPRKDISACSVSRSRD